MCVSQHDQIDNLVWRQVNISLRDEWNPAIWGFGWVITWLKIWCAQTDEETVVVDTQSVLFYMSLHVCEQQ